MRTKTEQPEVARIVIEVLANRIDILPTEHIVRGLGEEGIAILTATVETIKGKRLKGRLLKDAREALDRLINDEGDH